MPEMPEVDAVARRLTESCAGEIVKQLQILRSSISKPQLVGAIEKAVKGKTFHRARRRGKHLFLEFSGGTILHAHLRMTGNIFKIPDARFHSTKARAVFTLTSGAGIVFEDSRALGKLHLTSGAEAQSIEQQLGWEPLDPNFTVQVFQAMAKPSSKPSKIFLMEQRYVAGLGNIYVAEILFKAGVSPLKPMKSLKATDIHKTYSAIRTVMTEAVESVYDAYQHPGSFAEGEIFPVQVYDREGQPCFRCKQTIQRIPQSGRSTYFCPGCQR